MEIKEAWDLLIDYNIATYEELSLITDINGFSIESLEDVLYSRVGYRCFEQFKEEEGYL